MKNRHEHREVGDEKEFKSLLLRKDFDRQVPLNVLEFVAQRTSHSIDAHDEGAHLETTQFRANLVQLEVIPF